MRSYLSRMTARQVWVLAHVLSKRCCQRYSVRTILQYESAMQELLSRVEIRT